eukprot:3240811-Alexandrium_andersonii.AAC.1
MPPASRLRWVHWDDVPRRIGRVTYLSPLHKVIHQHPSTKKSFASHVAQGALRVLIPNTTVRMQRFKVDLATPMLPLALTIRDFYENIKNGVAGPSAAVFDE